TSMTPPGIDGYDPNYNPYPSGAGNSGDVAKAKQELQACGKPNGFSTKFAYATPSTTAPNIFKAEQAALGKVGIKITAATSDQAIMNDAVYLPYVWGKTLYYRNPRMQNVTCDNAIAFGIYDFVNIGVSK